MVFARVRYWAQDTDEAGHWILTGLIPRDSIKEWLEYFRQQGIRAEIVEDSGDES